MGTIGGNICQSTRCWYYWVPSNRFNCMRKGGSVCYAITGEERYHSIFGAVEVATPPCSSDCPAGVDIPSYMSRIRDGNLVEAAKILLTSNPLPAITGRVCPHFCEQGCNRGDFDEPMSIRSIERFIGDHILENATKFIIPPEIDTGKRRQGYKYQGADEELRCRVPCVRSLERKAIGDKRGTVDDARPGVPEKLESWD
jgi:hypothetical protein